MNDNQNQLKAITADWDLPIYAVRLVPPTGIKYGFIKGEAIRLFRTNSSKKKHLKRAFWNSNNASK